MSIITRRPAHAFTAPPVPPVPPVPPAPAGPSDEQLLAAARAEIAGLRTQLGQCEAAYRGWRHRALVAEQTLRNLPAALARPDALIKRLYGEAETAKVQLAELRAQLAQQQPTTDPEDGAK